MEPVVHPQAYRCAPVPESQLMSNELIRRIGFGLSIVSIIDDGLCLPRAKPHRNEDPQPTPHSTGILLLVRDWRIPVCANGEGV